MKIYEPYESYYKDGSFSFLCYNDQGNFHMSFILLTKKVFYVRHVCTNLYEKTGESNESIFLQKNLFQFRIKLFALKNHITKILNKELVLKKLMVYLYNIWISVLSLLNFSYDFFLYDKKEITNRILFHGIQRGSPGTNNLIVNLKFNKNSP